MSIAVYQHISLHGTTEVWAAYRITHVERFQQWELRDEIQSGIVVGQYLGAIDAA